MPISITLTIPDPAIPRIQAAMTFFETLEGETERQKFIRLTRNYWIDLDQKWRGQQARLGVGRDETVIEST